MVSGRFQVTQRNRRGAIPCRATDINRETSLRQSMPRNIDGTSSSSVNEHYRSKLAKRAAPAEQKQSIAMASCETITPRRKLPFEVPRNSPFLQTGMSQEVKCRYRVERAPQFRGMVHFAVH
ncbi:hypothetical protein ALC53_00558 [Atta colombica]|uniref:Uncharacterized protein n=1 Tax=Atta colombica TaxID=520822 RepID=A0A195BWL0_9HYME|nr:hypothetical protein ALC53_00558 [Atta colombica]